MEKVIPALYSLLLIVTPLIFFPGSSELFEFNKTIVLYSFTILIVAAWATKIIIANKFIFRRTILDIPLLLFLLSQILSTIFSIDIHTSVFGYYSRFNGSLLSTICYVLLYWGYVSNINTKHNLKIIKMLLLASAIVAIYASFEHFGISPSCLIINQTAGIGCWAQDVQNRVFATIGQPNWLAAWVIALIPIALAFYLKFKNKYYALLSIALFLALLFTKSRSGILAFVVTYLAFFVFKRVKTKIHLYFLLAAIFFGTPWTPSISQIISPKVETVEESGPALETGGTESGTLRLIVWRGALDIIRHNPLFGTGVETFAYSYYQFRPTQHNLTSEWDYLYNKAHNELLNIGANTGLFGLLTYIALFISMLIQLIKSKGFLSPALLAGFTGLLVTNFFGFSVVVTSLQFFLYPALAIAATNKVQKIKFNSLILKQKLLLLSVVLISLYLLLISSLYWYSDYLYSQGRKQIITNPPQAVNFLNQAIMYNSYQPVFYSELANAYANLALQSSELADVSFDYSKLSTKLSPRNVNLLKAHVNLLVDLGQIDQKYYTHALEAAQNLVKLAPTDPSASHTIGLILANLGELELAVQYLEEAIKLKPDYKKARMAAGLIYVELEQLGNAEKHFTFILEKISPDDDLVKKQLQRVREGEKKP